MDIRLEKTRIPPHLSKYFEDDLCSSCYVCHTVEILREVRRVLRADGVVFWNIGDSYVNNPSNGRGNSKQGEGGKPHHSGMNTAGIRLQDKQMNLISIMVYNLLSFVVE